jgi:hypothetical protein
MRHGFMEWRYITQPEMLANLRTLAVLGRLAHLPTVWSNCLAGWLLSGGGGPAKFLVLCAGASCFYLGGMFLNDVCDAEYDRLHRRERPIASGAIALPTALFMSVGWFLIGALLLVALGKTAAVLTVLLLGNIVLYNLLHRIVPLSPVLMASCRFFLYLVAGAATVDGISGLTVWSGLALGAYIVGLSYLARKEAFRGLLRHWICALLATPVLLAAVVNGPGYKFRAFIFAAALVAWILWCLSYTFWVGHRNIPHTVSGLWAGIVLVDLLAVGISSPLWLVFLLWFMATLLFQRVAPAA